MQAVILAAGQSNRFYPFSNFGHKALVKIMGKTLLEHTLLSIKKTGIDDVVIVVGNNNILQDIIGDGSRLHLDITYVTQPEPLGMGEALLRAAPYITSDFFLLNAYHVEFSEFAQDMMKKERKENEVVLLGKKHEGVDRYGFMQTEGDMVTNIIEKPNKETEGLRIIGVYLLNRNFLTVLEKTPLEHYHFEEALHMYAKTGKVRFVETQKEVLTLKYAWDLLEIKNYLLRDLPHSISSRADISPHAIIIGNVFIEDGVKVFEGACIKGPCYIGKDTVVGNNALLRDKTVLEEQTVAGSYMEMKNVLMMSQSTSHSGFIGDSVIGNNCKIGAMFCSANARLDRQKVAAEVKQNKVDSLRKHLGVIVGDNVVTGAGVTTMPGVIIGNDTFIGPSTTVMKNVEDNATFYTEFKNIVKK